MGNGNGYPGQNYKFWSLFLNEDIEIGTDEHRDISKCPKRSFADIISDYCVLMEFSIFMTEGCYKFKNLEF